MDSFQSFKLQADQKLKVADHLLGTTYSLVKEPKLLVSIIENLFAAMDFSIAAILEYEKSLKNISSYPNTFDGRLEMFRRKVMPRHGIDKAVIDFTLELRSTVDEHKRSSVEFSKKEKFVISDNDYNLKTLSLDEVKKKLAQTKKYSDYLLGLARLE